MRVASDMRVNLPFTREAFLDTFARYNAAVWPLQIVLLAIAVGCVLLPLIGRRGERAAGALLALLWAYTAIAYHFVFFTRINPAAWGFGALSLVGAAVLAVQARRSRLLFDVSLAKDRAPGLLLIAYALIGYPLVGWLTGHAYPRAPTFGLPCPTTIFTLGMLLLARRPTPASVFVVPFLWSAVGSVAAFALGVAQDYGLTLALLICLGVLVLRDARIGAKQRLLGAVMRRWLLRELDGQLAKRGDRQRRDGLAAVAIEAFEIQRQAPPALQEPSSAAWLTLAATVLAAHRALQRSGLAADDAARLIGECLTAPMRRHARRYLGLRFGIDERHPDQAFSRITAEFIPRGAARFGARWSFAEAARDDESYGVRVSRCLFVDFFAWAGAPELTPLLCELDAVWGAELSQPRYGVTFHRDRTLAAGAEACSFDFRRVSGHSG